MKKVLALVMVLALVFSMGVSALAAEEAKEHDAPHATKPPTTSEATMRTGGVVGPDGKNTDVSTDIYLRVAADDDLPPEVKVKVLGEGEDGQVYVVDYTDRSKSTFSATVPLYVCLYAYGQSGGVATPDKNSYQIKNLSTYSVDIKIDKITEYYPIYTSVVDMLKTIVGNDAVDPGDTDDATFIQNHITDDQTKTKGGQTFEDIVAVMQESNNHYYYYQNNVVKAYDVYVDADGVRDKTEAQQVVRLDGYGSTKFYQTAMYDQTAAHPAPDAGITFALNGKTYTGKKPGDYLVPKVENALLALVVSEINATTYGWTLVQDTPLKAKELYLTINGANIADAVESPLVLGGSEWLVKSSADTANPGTLGLKINAGIAPNINAIEESAVVNVAYTLAGEIDPDITGVVVP